MRLLRERKIDQEKFDSKVSCSLNAYFLRYDHKPQVVYLLFIRLAQLNYVWQDNLDVIHISRFLEERKNECLQQLNTLPLADPRRDELTDSCDKMHSIITDFDSFKVIMFHQNVARAQRLAYNNHRTDVNHLRDKIMIEVDFKQKILIGFGPRQINTEYYDNRNRQRTCLGDLICFLFTYLLFINK